MAKRDKYNPDYQKLYPGVVITPEIAEVLKRSDRKIRYMEVDIKHGVFKQDSSVQAAAFFPTREDSLERLIDEEGMSFVSPEASPEDVAVHNDEIERLCTALRALKPEEYALIHAVFFENITEKALAKQAGITQQGISWRLQRILSKIRFFMEN